MSELVKDLREAEEQTPLDANEQHLQELCGKLANEIERLRIVYKEDEKDE